MIFSGRHGKACLRINRGCDACERCQGLSLGRSIESAPRALDVCSDCLGGVLGDILDTADTLGKITPGESIHDGRRDIASWVSLYK